MVGLIRDTNLHSPMDFFFSAGSCYYVLLGGFFFKDVCFIFTFSHFHPESLGFHDDPILTVAYFSNGWEKTTN